MMRTSFMAAPGSGGVFTSYARDKIRAQLFATVTGL
jgi:hypothetical protein